MQTHLHSRRACLRGLLGVAGALALGSAAAQADALARIRERGSLRVALYNDMSPFHAKGRGIEVDLAAALADALGVKASLLPFAAGEEMGDDLRNMVWKGHYLGYGPADVLLHVPVEAALMQANPQVSVFAPYYRERVAIARRLDRLPRMERLSDLAGHRVAVPGQTLAGWLLVGAEGGALREQLSTHWKDGVEAAVALKADEADAAAGLASELESVLQGDERFALTPLPGPSTQRGSWPVGLAVKRDAVELQAALQKAMEALASERRLAAIFDKHHVAWRPA